MRKLALLCFAAVLMLGLSKCGSKGDDGGGCTEAALAVSTLPANGTVDPPAPGPDFPLQVNITAGLPSAGVTIQVTAKAESPANATPFFNQTFTATAANNTYTITGTPTATSCIVTVTITSKSCGNNKTTSTYRYSRK